MGIKIEVDCPKCRTVHKISANAEGNLLKCKKCRNVIDLTKATGQVGGRSATGRRAKGGGEKGGRRPRKPADVWPLIAVCGFLLFVGLIVLLVVATGSDTPSPPKSDDSADASKDSGKSTAPDPEDEPAPENPGPPPEGDRPPREDPEKPPKTHDDPEPPEDPGREEPKDPDPGPGPEEPRKSLGVRRIEIPEKTSADDRRKVQTLIADITGGDSQKGDAARAELQRMGRYVVPMILNATIDLDLGNEDHRIVGIYLTDILDAYRRDGRSFGFRDAAFGDDPDVGSLKRIREKCFEFYDSKGFE